jgi:hypothetical protein
MSKLQITLSEEATKKYLELMSESNRAHVESDCEPSSALLLVEFHHIFECEVYLSSNTNVLLGEVQIDFVE